MVPTEISYLKNISCFTCKDLLVMFVDKDASSSSEKDSVSHKFLDTALQEAGASDKFRAVFRAMYK